MTETLDTSPGAVDRHTELMLRYNLIEAAKCMDALSAERDTLRAEVGRLRGALERIEMTEFCAAPASEEGIKARQIARAALTTKEKPHA